MLEPLNLAPRFIGQVISLWPNLAAKQQQNAAAPMGLPGYPPGQSVIEARTAQLPNHEADFF